MAGAPQKDEPLQSFNLNAKGTLPKDGMLTKDKIQVSAAAARWNGTKKKSILTEDILAPAKHA